jgi:hypothetical protein
MQVNIQRLIEYFDEAPNGSSKHSKSLASLLGEDISIVLFKDFLTNQRQATVRILDGTPTTGNRKGHWLDKWVTVDFPDGRRILYQAEIKTWSAHATHGERLMRNATTDIIHGFRIRHWNTFWDAHSNTINTKWTGLTKVLIPMRRPESVDNNYVLQPLLVYWMAIHPQGENECFFDVQLGLPGVQEHPFAGLTVFSVSSYLRTLAVESLDLDLPDVATRIEWLKLLFPEQRAGGG